VGALWLPAPHVSPPLYLCRSFYGFFFFRKRRRISGPGTNPTRISNSCMISSEILLGYSIVYSQVDHVQLFFINLFIYLFRTMARPSTMKIVLVTSKQSENSKRKFV
jgi:hypothetical protein